MFPISYALDSIAKHRAELFPTFADKARFSHWRAVWWSSRSDTTTKVEPKRKPPALIRTSRKA